MKSRIVTGGLVLVASLSGCVYGYRTNVMVHTLAPPPLEPFTAAENITLRWGVPDLPDSQVVQIAMIEVEGRKYEDTGSLIRKAREKAAALGANCLAIVDQGTMLRKRGEFITEMRADLDGDPNTNDSGEEYQAPTLQAIALYIRPRSQADLR